MSAGDMASLFGIWATSLAPYANEPPFGSSSSLLNTIDSSCLGEVSWENFTVTYNGPMSENPDDVPPWMKADYEVWFHNPHDLVNNMIANPDFNGEFDTTPFHEYDADHKHRFQNFMSGDWAWNQVVGLTSFLQLFMLRTFVEYYHP